MKFTCDNCRAKYQIADEKVAGKTVRMKCRKCGSPIQVRARRTEHGVEAMPVGAGAAAPAGPPRQAPGSPSPGVQVGGAAARPGPPRPGAPPRRSAPPAPPGGGQRGGFGAPGAAAVRPFGPSTPLRTGHPERSLRDEFEDDEATVVMQRPTTDAPKSASAGRPLPAAGRAAAPPTPSPVVPSAGGASRPAAVESAPQSAEQQWYVGIQGKPVGPKPESFLQEKLSTGEIDGSSLVWNEELPDWKPLRAIPELSALLPASSPEPVPAALAAGAAPSDRAAEASGSAPAVGVPPAAVSDPLALVHVKDEAAAGQAAMPDAPVGLGAEPFGGLPGPLAPQAAAAGPASAPPGAPAEITGLSDLHALEEKLSRKKQRDRRRRKRGLTPVAWAFIAMAGGFGAVAAYVVFSSPPGETLAYGAGGASSQPTALTAGGPPTGSGDPTVTRATVVLDPVNVEPGGESPQGAGASAAANPTAGATTEPGRTPDIDRSGFDTGGPSGPSSGPGSSGGDSKKSQLSTAEIQATVNRYKGAVSRRCMPIVESGSSSGATSARVTASLTVGPSGSVQSASASGGKDFPGLASCVAGRVRSWKFPASSGTTRVNVPFHFIAQ